MKKNQDVDNNIVFYQSVKFKINIPYARTAQKKKKIEQILIS
jgi:hypothetical protein